MSNFQIHELSTGALDRDSNLVHDTEVSTDVWNTRKATAGAVADLASANVAAAYASATTYAIGRYCLYEGVIYRCIAITTGAFDSTAWTPIVVTGEFRRVVELNSAQYAALTPAEQNNGTIYVKTDEETTADDIPYSQGVSVADKIDDVEAKIPSIIEVNSSTSSNLTANNIVTVSFTVNVPTGYKIVSIINTTYSSNFLMDVIRIEDGDGSRTVRVNVWSNTTYSSQNLSIRAICANNLIVPT